MTHSPETPPSLTTVAPPDALPEEPNARGTATRPRAGARHHWVVRLTHWVSAGAIVLMVGSGLRIFNAYPAFHPKGETFCC